MQVLINTGNTVGLGEEGLSVNLIFSAQFSFKPTALKNNFSSIFLKWTFKGS